MALIDSTVPVPEPEDDFEWMIVEVFGHRRHVGRVREEERFGAKMLRIDVPTVERAAPGAGPGLTATSWTTHYYGGAALFSATPTDAVTGLQANLRSLHREPYLLTAADEEEFSF